MSQIRSNPEHVTFIFRHNCTLFSIQEVRIENDSDRKYSKSKFCPSFSENHVFSTIHVTLFIISRKYFFGFSKSAPTLRYTILDSRVPLVMRSRKAGLPFASRAWKRELSIQEVRIENDSDQKFSKSKFVLSFSENHFFPRFMLPCSLLAKNIFSDKKTEIRQKSGKFVSAGTGF